MAEIPKPQETQRQAQATGSGKPGQGPRVVVFTGPKEGSGSTTTCLNLALAWAGTSNRQVIIVQMDPLCRNDLSFQLGLKPPTLVSFSQMVAENPTGLGRLLRGRIPLTRWGVGLLPLAAKRQEVLKLSPDLIVKTLGALSESYDLFLDVDPYFPMQVFAFDLADLIYWTCLPQRHHCEATYSLFTEFKSLHFSMGEIPSHRQPGQPSRGARRAGSGALLFGD